MNNYWMMKVVKTIFLVAFAILAMGWLVMFLWNWLLPELLGLPVINFWQSLGLILLSKLLFGNIHKGGHKHQWKHRYWKERMHRKLENMSEEQKEEFRAKMEKRCGYWSGWHKDQGEAPQETEQTN